jgi:hypothetical protein
MKYTENILGMQVICGKILGNNTSFFAATGIFRVLWPDGVFGIANETPI